MRISFCKPFRFLSVCVRQDFSNVTAHKPFPHNQQALAAQARNGARQGLGWRLKAWTVVGSTAQGFFYALIGQCIGPLIARIAIVAFDPPPVDLVS